MAKKSSSKMKFDVMQFAGNIAGAIAAKVVISKLPIQNNLIKNVAPIVLGAILSGTKNKTISGAGLGMVAVGGAGLVGTLVPTIAGFTGDVLNGTDDYMAGTDDYMAGDDYVGADDVTYLSGASGNVLDGLDDNLSGASYYNRGSRNVLNGPDEYIAGADEYMA